MQYYLAIDIGASSGRHILGHVEDGKMILEEMYRFDNKQVHVNCHDCWDMENLWNGILGGMKACGDAGKIPVSVGIDTWAVDYVLLDENGESVGDAVAYRDKRTEGADDLLKKYLSEEELYARTGIQKQLFNTVYQLLALKEEHPEQLEQAVALLMIPDYFDYKLTGVKKQEYTNASSTNLLNAAEKTWDYDLIRTLGLPEHLFGDLSMPGETVGNLLPEVRDYVGFDTTVVLPATHDTGSAFLAVPARDDNAVYISSGTWSLLGVENEAPITTEESRNANFTNEGGAWYRFRYLKNIMGLWMIQSVRRELNGTSYVAGKTSKYADGKQYSFADLETQARECPGISSVVDCNDAAFLSPDSMIDVVKDACRKSNQPVPETVGELMQVIYQSLAESYRKAVLELQKLTGKTYTSLNIVGGGSKDPYLSALTAKALGIPVYTGPTEGTAIGNLIVQMIRGGEYKNLAEARTSIRNSFNIQEVTL